MQDVRLKHLTRRSEITNHVPDSNDPSAQNSLGAHERYAAMNAKIAADALIQIADVAEQTGQVPAPQLATLIARLEAGNKTASANLPKAVTAFRALARELRAQTNPSRTKLAGVLRRILADTMPMAPLSTEAPLAGAGEDFQKANPKITDEQAAKIDEEHEKNKSNFKSATYGRGLYPVR